MMFNFVLKKVFYVCLFFTLLVFEIFIFLLLSFSSGITHLENYLIMKVKITINFTCKKLQFGNKI